MSRIYFHTLEKDIEIHGSERAYMGYVINNIALSFLSPDLYEDKIKALLPTDCYLIDAGYRGKEFANNFATWFRVSYNASIGGSDTFAVALNTAYKFGSDQIKLMCRLHGQSEIHCWVSSKHAAWLAEIIRDGIASGIYRSNAGWDELMNFCEKYNGDSPIVCSYSVCEQFPNSYYAEYDHRRKWENLSEIEKWAAGEKYIYKHNGLQITPENWNSFYFNDGKTAIDILKGGTP